MGSTTVHIPDDMLRRVDQVARRRGISRNRLVMESLQAEITRDGGEWPANFFEPPPEEDLAVVREAVDEFEQHTRTHRRNRGAPIL
ncbi:MAG: ribbon-helix-helix protein, CopG family [Alkalispirochaeta sp.]